MLRNATCGILGVILGLGCGAAGNGRAPAQVHDDDFEHVSEIHGPVFSDADMAAPMPDVVSDMRATAPKVTYFNPGTDNHDLLELTLRVIDRVHARTNAPIEISETGIPVVIRDGARQGSAATDEWCFGGGCTAEHVYIYISSETLDRMFVDNFADNSLAHEFVHVLSGWGHCTDMDVDGHLTPGHIVSNGNTGYGQMSWTDADTQLACSCGAC